MIASFNARAQLAAFVLASWESFRWRRHGIGLVQAYVREGEGTETRVHVWHPNLVRPGIVDHGDVHDHRFSFVSTILVGAITNRIVTELVPHRDGAYQVHQVRHARINPEGAFAAEPMRVVPGPLDARAEFVDITFEEARIEAGQSYRFERGSFHCTRVDELAVTVVTKYYQIDAGARILALRDLPPVPAFDPEDAHDVGLVRVIDEVLFDAKVALQRAEGSLG